MEKYYSKTTVYLTQRQKDIITKFMPYKLSGLLRDVIDIVLLSDKRICPEDFQDDPELLGLLYEYRRYLNQSKETFRNREALKAELYQFFDSQSLPYNCAATGHRAALKMCRSLVKEFRAKGYIISDRLAEDMIVEYVNTVEALGKDDQAWAEWQALEAANRRREAEEAAKEASNIPGNNGKEYLS